MQLMHMHQLVPLYKGYGLKKISGVIWGHRGQKVIFTKKIIIRLYNIGRSLDMHIHYLETLYPRMGSKVIQRSFEVTGSNMLKNFKNFYFKT